VQTLAPPRRIIFSAGAGLLAVRTLLRRAAHPARPRRHYRLQPNHREMPCRNAGSPSVRLATCLILGRSGCRAREHLRPLGFHPHNAQVIPGANVADPPHASRCRTADDRPHHSGGGCTPSKRTLRPSAGAGAPWRLRASIRKSRDLSIDGRPSEKPEIQFIPQRLLGNCNSSCVGLGGTTG
jgi:hypothetical protein